LPDALAEVDAECLVLALEPGATDAQHRAAVRDVVERRRELRGQARVPERVRPDHESQPDARRDRGDAGEECPALEDRLLPGPLDREQVVPGPDRVPAGRLRRQRRLTDLWPGGLLGPQLQPESDVRHAAARLLIEMVMHGHDSQPERDALLRAEGRHALLIVLGVADREGDDVIPGPRHVVDYLLDDGLEPD